MQEPHIIDVDISGKVKGVDFTLFFLSDPHIGADAMSKPVLDAFIRRVSRTPNSFWFNNGDLIDADRPSMRDRLAIAHADHGRSEARRKLDKDRQAGLKEYAIRKLMPIRDKLGGLLDGDHFIQFDDGTTSGSFIAGRLGKPRAFLGERIGAVVLRFHRYSSVTCFKILLRHYRGSHASDGADVNGLQKANVRDEGFDIYVGAHTHRQNCTPAKYRYLTAQHRFAYRVAWYIRGGTLLDAYPAKQKTYAESAEYPSVPLGWAEATVSIAREGAHNITRAVCNFAGLRSF